MSQQIVANVIVQVVVGEAGEIAAIPAAVADVVVREDLIVGDARGQGVVAAARRDDAAIVCEVEATVMHGTEEIDAQTNVSP